MSYRMNAFARGLAAVVLTAWCGGCTDNRPQGPAARVGHSDEHAQGEHAPGKEHAGEHNGHGAPNEPARSGENQAHGGAALTEKDIDMPASIAASVERLEVLHGEIAKQIDGKELDHVHRTAEEMALVAKGVKKLAANRIPEDRLTELGRLCNEIAGYYEPIDEAADAGKLAETTEIHEKMGKAIERLKELTR